MTDTVGFGMIIVYRLICRDNSSAVECGSELQKGNRMNRRNVLGNQIESSKTLWIVLISLLVTAIQFFVFYCLDGGWLALLLAGLCILLGGIAVHALTGELEEVFPYLLFPCLCNGGVGLLLPHLSGEILPDSTTVFVGCFLTWLIPVVYGCLFTWAEGGSALPQFSSFYKRAAVLFYVVYFGVLIYWFVAYSRIPKTEISAQFIPFATFAAYVDGIISDTVPLERMLQFVAERIGLFLPYGFFVAMTGRKIHSLLRLGLVLVLPVIVEILQYILKFNSFDTDDIIFSFLGGLFGMLLFVVFNALFQKTTGKNFDGSEIEKDYYGRRI